MNRRELLKRIMGKILLALAFLALPAFAQTPSRIDEPHRFTRRPVRLATWWERNCQAQAPKWKFRAVHVPLSEKSFRLLWGVRQVRNYAEWERITSSKDLCLLADGADPRNNYFRRNLVYWSSSAEPRWIKQREVSRIYYESRE